MLVSCARCSIMQYRRKGMAGDVKQVLVSTSRMLAESIRLSDD